MAGLTLEQLQAMGAKPAAKTGGLTMDQVQAKKTQPTTFEQGPLGFLGKARNLATNVVGGGKLGEGLGLGLAAPKVQKSLSDTEQMGSNIQMDLIKRIREKKARGEDTSRLEVALKLQNENLGATQQTQQNFTEALPTNKQVIGSSLRLGATVVAPMVTKGVGNLFGAGKATTFLGGAARGGATGAVTGAVEGAAQGAGIGMEQNKDATGIATEAAKGAGIGLAGGAALGTIFGGVSGAMRGKNDPSSLLDNITPDPKELTPTQYQKYLAQGRITPKTSSSPARYVLDEGEKTIATKYSSVIAKDPVQTTLNINDKISSLDDEVGSFLRKNNGIFNKGELQNKLLESIDDVSDITIDSDRLSTEKAKLVGNFIKTLDKNDMESLWQARKNFDSKIENAFKGSPTLQKELKIAFRNAVQDFIADGTPDEVYKGYMKDMSGLFRLRDTSMLKATKERSLSGFGKWKANNPTKVKTVGWASAALGGGYLLGNLGSD